MKPKLLLLLFLLATFGMNFNVQAAFVIQSKHAASNNIEANTQFPIQRLLGLEQFIPTSYKSTETPTASGLPDTSYDTSGWEGIVALICGILALRFPLLSIPAVVFGALGMRHGKRHHGMAVAGLVMGVVILALFILLVLILASFALWAL